MSQALLPDRPEQVQPQTGRNAQAQVPAAGTDKAGGGRNAPPLPKHACPCPPAPNEICDLLRQVLAAVRSIKMVVPQALPPWSRPMTFADAARRYGVPERTFRSWLKMPNSNGIKHKRLGKMVMIDQRDLPAGQRGP